MCMKKKGISGFFLNQLSKFNNEKALFLSSLVLSLFNFSEIKTAIAQYNSGVFLPP